MYMFILLPFTILFWLIVTLSHDFRASQWGKYESVTFVENEIFHMGNYIFFPKCIDANQNILYDTVAAKYRQV